MYMYLYTIMHAKGEIVKYNLAFTTFSKNFII